MSVFLNTLLPVVVAAAFSIGMMLGAEMLIERKR